MAATFPGFALAPALPAWLPALPVFTDPLCSGPPLPAGRPVRAIRRALIAGIPGALPAGSGATLAAWSPMGETLLRSHVFTAQGLAVAER